jgi:anaerobic ribonucleoside-triphosphate reductase activating protein
MKYAGLILNDFNAAPGVSVSFYTQGCPHRCQGCHNPQTWDFNGGKEFDTEVLKQIINGLTANGIERSLCIMGGEPLCEENQFLVSLIIDNVKEKLPETKIYIWTGYIYDELSKVSSSKLKNILSKAYCIIDGPYIEAERDITLSMRGSRNQNIIYLDNSKNL